MIVVLLYTSLLIEKILELVTHSLLSLLPLLGMCLCMYMCTCSCVCLQVGVRCVTIALHFSFLDGRGLTEPRGL